MGPGEVSPAVLGEGPSTQAQQPQGTETLRTGRGEAVDGGSSHVPLEFWSRNSTTVYPAQRLGGKVVKNLPVPWPVEEGCVASHCPPWPGEEGCVAPQCPREQGPTLEKGQETVTPGQQVESADGFSPMIFITLHQLELKPGFAP